MGEAEDCIVNCSKERGAVIVTASGYYFSHWACAMVWGIDDSDSYHYVPEFTKDPKRAYVYEDKHSAQRALPRVRNKGFIVGGRMAVVS
ncbi:hypothetical protein LCGC14_1867120 [marine sediment metagenome]|uniref:Uncharacterized protein n=1 Tax=marine sediment metagenome TaxID=412755 RepID=A0A0F9G642_9ZZZZ